MQVQCVFVSQLEERHEEAEACFLEAVHVTLRVCRLGAEFFAGIRTHRRHQYIEISHNVEHRSILRDTGGEAFGTQLLCVHPTI